MGKNLFFMYLVILSFAFTGCGTSFSGSRTGNSRQFIMEYSILNATDSQQLLLDAGDLLKANLTVTKGSLSVRIQKNDDPPVYESFGLTSSKAFELEIPEAGIYTVTVTGKKAEGSVCFTASAKTQGGP